MTPTPHRDNDVVRLEVVAGEHERRLNIMENHLKAIERSVEGLREDLNSHAHEMIAKVSSFTLAVKIAGAIGAAVLVTVLGLLAALVQKNG